MDLWNVVGPVTSPLPPPLGAATSIADRPLAQHRAAVACHHHGVPDERVWTYNSFQDYLLEKEDYISIDGKTFQRAMQGTESAQGVPHQRHPIWRCMPTSRLFWDGDVAIDSLLHVDSHARAADHNLEPGEQRERCVAVLAPTCRHVLEHMLAPQKAAAAWVPYQDSDEAVPCKLLRFWEFLPASGASLAPWHRCNWP